MLQARVGLVLLRLATIFVLGREAARVARVCLIFHSVREVEAGVFSR